MTLRQGNKKTSVTTKKAFHAECFACTRCRTALGSGAYDLLRRSLLACVRANGRAAPLSHFKHLDPAERGLVGPLLARPSPLSSDHILRPRFAPRLVAPLASLTLVRQLLRGRFGALLRHALGGAPGQHMRGLQQRRVRQDCLGGGQEVPPRLLRTPRPHRCQSRGLES